MPNNENNQQRQRNIASGASIVLGAVGVLGALAAAEHVQAQEENRESIVQGVGRWFRDNILDAAHTSSIGAGSSATHGGIGAGAAAPPRRLSPSEINVLPVRRITNTRRNTTVTTIPASGTEDMPLAETTRTTQQLTSEEDEKNFCVVCREYYDEGDLLMRLPCFHEFHSECIRGYLETCEAPVCPICRHPVTIS